MSSLNFIIDPPIIAHRGAKKYAPENTLAAFSQTKKLGVNWVEFDVMLSKCGEVVVIHDDTLKRTTNVKGNVRDFDYEYLKTLDAGSWFHASFFEERIPTLSQVIELLYNQKLYANIEIKAFPGLEKETVKNVLSVLQQEWPAEMPPPLISSFSLQTLQYVRKYSSDSLLAFLMDKWRNDWDLICDQLECACVDVNYKILSREKVAEIKSTNRKVLAYTVNDAEAAKILFSWGVDAVFSDDPEMILSVL